MMKSINNMRIPDLVLDACVSQPNTPETDAMEFVDHDVTVQYSNGEIKVLKVKARDPQDAIEGVMRHG